MKKQKAEVEKWSNRIRPGERIHEKEEEEEKKAQKGKKKRTKRNVK